MICQYITAKEVNDIPTKQESLLYSMLLNHRYINGQIVLLYS